MRAGIFCYIILSAISFSGTGQTQPYTYILEIKYKMTSQPDSMDATKKNSEFMTLLIGKNQSLFCATQYLAMDSASTAEHKKGNKTGISFAFLQANGTKNWLSVFKNDTDLIVTDQIARFIIPQEIVFYKEPKNQFNWKILPDTASIGGIRCQKAETAMGGRNWEAWFAPSIPVADGPYKFNGLPGLILQVYDKKKYWQFDLASIQNINKSLQLNFLDKKPVPIKDKQTFLSRKKYSMENRLLLMKQNGWRISNEVSARKQYEEEAKRDNNWIELYLPQK
jgi:GLPGLI family protein